MSLKLRAPGSSLNLTARTGWRPVLVAKYGVTMRRMIAPDLLESLACPVCRKPLVLRGEASLKCNECKRVYPIRNGIPILLESEASIDPL
jgi:uncharacterized protein YbaR (Trm112 family)